MNNEAQAVKCSLHVPQIATHAYILIITVHRKEVGVRLTSHVKLITNVKCTVRVKFSIIFQFEKLVLCITL